MRRTGVNGLFDSSFFNRGHFDMPEKHVVKECAVHDARDQHGHVKSHRPESMGLYPLSNFPVCDIELLWVDGLCGEILAVGRSHRLADPAEIF